VVRALTMAVLRPLKSRKTSWTEGFKGAPPAASMCWSDCSVERKEGGKGKIKQIQYLNFNL